MTWRPIADLPPAGHYLGFLAKPLLNGARVHTIMVRHGRVFLVATMFAHDAPPVTHWMPLPSPPPE